MARNSRKVSAKKKSSKFRAGHAWLIHCACDRVACMQTNQARSDAEREAGSLARGAVESVSTGAISALIRLACRAAKAEVAAVNARKNGHREKSDVVASIGGCSVAVGAAVAVACVPNCSLGDAWISAWISALCGSSRPTSRALDGSSDRALTLSFIAPSLLEDPCTTVRRHRCQVG